MRRRDRLSLMASAIAMAVATLVIGSALRWTQATVALLVAVALVIQITARRRIDRLSPLVLVLGLTVGLTALQLLPLPAAVLDWLDPVGTNLRAESARIAGTAS